jgi:hypothetical protein
MTHGGHEFLLGRGDDLVYLRARYGSRHAPSEMVETMAKQAARTVGSQIGRQILRGVLGGIGKSR